MTRRDAAWLIARASAVAGGATVGADRVNAQHAAPPQADRWKSYRPAFFTAGQYQILDAFTSILIPADETPGARDAHVAPFIDFVVNAAAEFAPETQAEWRHAMGWLQEQGFATLPIAAQAALVNEMAGPERDHAQHHDGFFAYRLIKDITVRAFYTSRIGLVDVLEYRGNAYLTAFPACTHPEHHKV